MTATVTIQRVDRRDRFTWQAGDLVEGRPDPVPVIASDLLRLLKVEQASLEDQRTAVSGWLASHEASPFLLASLIRAGLTD